MNGFQRIRPYFSFDKNEKIIYVRPDFVLEMLCTFPVGVEMPNL